MTEVRSAPPERGGDPRATSTRVPARADGVTLIGELAGSGYREPPMLVRRGDGQTLQFTPLLHHVLEAVDGRRDLDEVAARVSDRFGRTVTAENVAHLCDEKLRPLGLLTTPDGRQPELKRSNPLLALRFKYAVTDPERTRRLTAPFARLFHPVVVVAVLAGFLALSWWVLLDKGLASATYQAFDRPALLLLVLAVTVLSAGFHEFGHAAGARRGGATPGVMGAGVYLVWPAFYTDVTDSYRLGRGGRLRTDLGGLYFNAIVAVAIAACWWASGWDALLLVVAAQILQMVRQLTPLVRFDGYHVLADLTGVPDLFHRIGPTLRSLLPWHWNDPAARVLKPWARAVVTLWVLVVVPVLLFSLATMVLALPRVLGTAWLKLQEQAAATGDAWARSDVIEVAARCVAVVALVFPLLAMAVILVRLVRRVVGSVWTRTRGRPAQRVTAGVLAAAMLGGVAWAWWPDPGTYRPIQPFERGSVLDAVRALPVARAASPALRVGDSGTLTTAWPQGEPLPTADRPQLAVVLVPHSPTGSTAATGGAPTGGSPAGADGRTGWVFPFTKPLAPGPGDNQAMAVNTTDGTVRYDVAFAMVWADGSQPATNTNEAYAFASCTGCAAVAVAFQVVFVVGDNHAAAPQNISAAVNYDCVNCLTYALAVQLFVTLDRPLSTDAVRELHALWAQVREFGAHLEDVPLSEIQSRLTDYEQQILAIAVKDGAVGAPTDPGTGASAAPSGSPSGTPTDAAATSSPGSTPPSGSAEADPGGAPGTAAGTTPTGAATAGSSPTSGSTSAAPGTTDPSPTPTASPTASASPSAGAEATTSPTP